MTPPKHILGTFDEALASLRSNVLMMAGLAERSLDRAIKGLLKRDDNLCATAIADDEEIDQLEKQIDKDGVDVLLRFQPVASDLRRVIAAMKLSPNIERVADQATNIARRARKLNKHPPLPEIEIMVPIQTHAMAMFKDGIDAFAREDVDLGRAVVARDKDLDYMNKMANRKLTERMAQAQSQPEAEESAAIVPITAEQTAHERFGDQKNFINRELSWLEFNRRVLEEAQDPTQPLIERVKFLYIFSSNLDEFFEIRVAGIKQQIESETSDVAADGLSPTETFNQIQRLAHELVATEYELWNKELIPQLAKNGIRVRNVSELNAKRAAWARKYFQEEVLPMLTPLAVDASHPFPELGSTFISLR
ncbi:MAG: phosphate transport system regulatory protein PhoU [Verrucomicrobia bacterium]|nr:MAG: phosphate transport system regulatory protein PhoU [Verrucomicrobiota bacterium]